MNPPRIFIGIGDQKAATGWIFKCLDEHPDYSRRKNLRNLGKQLLLNCYETY